MTRDIDFSKPLSADDTQYVQERPWLAQDAVLRGETVQLDGADEEFTVATAQEDQGGNGLIGSGSLNATAEDTSGDYADNTVDELKEELKERGLTVGGSKEQLIARLVEDDNTPEDQ